jgi:DNA-directed RNA polymerase subunit RPC12/RpoP
MTNPEINPQFCYRHPNTETSLRCNRCDRPICSRCAIHTETGYRCPECIRGQQKIFDTAKWYDFILAISVAIILSVIGSLLVTMIGIFTIFLAPGAGMVISEAVRYIIHRRRNRTLFKLTGLAVFIGGILTTIPLMITMFASGISGMFDLSFWGYSLLSLAWPLIYSVLASTACYTRLAGLHLR